MIGRWVDVVVSFDGFGVIIGRPSTTRIAEGLEIKDAIAVGSVLIVMIIIGR